MLFVADDDLEGVLRAVVAARPFARVADFLPFVVVIDIRPALLVAIAPAAEADHLVVFFPVAEGVVGRVDDDQPAAVLDIVDEVGLGLLRPARAVVIRDNNAIIGELGMKLVHPVLTWRRR